METVNTILLKVKTEEEKKAKEKTLQTLCDNLSNEALAFLAEISARPMAEKKLLANRIIINAFLK